MEKVHRLEGVEYGAPITLSYTIPSSMGLELKKLRVSELTRYLYGMVLVFCVEKLIVKTEAAGFILRCREKCA
ncbi:hypothetical protein [Shewanella benthica]|uniref:hypothetical protein n=1 Tax=Shewanella benthica TaxID=43661 RepID=UPI000C1C831E|nr:hypothetical protein [Shewanella benthica]